MVNSVEAEVSRMKKTGITTIKAFLYFVTLTIFIFCISSPVSAGWMDDGKKLLQGLEKKGQGELSVEEIAGGLKDALKVGSGRVTKKLGRVDGFNLDPKAHIPLPKNLQKVRKVLKKIGKKKLADDLEIRLNRAAETAAPKAKELFMKAIRKMTLKDAKKIYKGPEDAATRYFKENMTASLSAAMKPVINESLSKVGAIKSYDKLIRRYKKIPFVPDVRGDLTKYVTKKGIEAIFYYLAEEEAKIRKDPAKRTTELLRRVFGAN